MLTNSILSLTLGLLLIAVLPIFKDESHSHLFTTGVSSWDEISGRPGRIGGLRRFIDYARQYPDVWLATREEIAREWLALYT